LDKGSPRQRAKVDEIIDMLDMQSDEMYCFLDTKTGDPFYLDEEMHTRNQRFRPLSKLTLPEKI